MSAFESIKQGLTEAMAFAEGREVGAVVRQVEVPTVDVASIRASTGPVARRVRAQHRCRQGYAAQLGARSPSSDRPRPGAARHDRQEAFAGKQTAKSNE